MFSIISIIIFVCTAVSFIMYIEDYGIIGKLFKKKKLPILIATQERQPYLDVPNEIFDTGDPDLIAIWKLSEKECSFTIDELIDLFGAEKVQEYKDTRFPPYSIPYASPALHFAAYGSISFDPLWYQRDGLYNNEYIDQTYDTVMHDPHNTNEILDASTVKINLDTITLEPNRIIKTS